MAKHSTKTKRGKRGAGRLYKRANGKEYRPESKVEGIYYLAYTVHGVRRRERLLDSKGLPITRRPQAEAARDRILNPIKSQTKAETLKTLAREIEDAEAETAAAIEAARPVLRLRETWAAFEDHPNRPDCGESTLKQYEFQYLQFENWLEAKHKAAESIRDVTPDIALAYARHLTRSGKAGNTYNKHLSLLCLVWSVLADEANVDCNPWTNPKKSPGGRGIARKALQTQSRRELTVDELCRVCEPLEGEMRVLFAVGIYTGLRLSDAATLQWTETDLARNRILRVPSKTARRKPDREVKIQIHPVLRGMLEETPKGRRRGPVLPDIARDYAKRRDLVTDRIQAHFEACKIETRKPGTGSNGRHVYDKKKKTMVYQSTGDPRAVVEVGFHSLRHTFVSLCSDANAPLSVVQALVGHGNPSMTRHYMHPSESAAESAIAALPAFDGTIDTAPAAAPLPAWALELIGNLSGRNWRRIKAELLKGGAK